MNEQVLGRRMWYAILVMFAITIAITMSVKSYGMMSRNDRRDTCLSGNDRLRYGHGMRDIKHDR